MLKKELIKKLAEIKKKQKERFDKDRIDSPFKLGDFVWWKSEAKTPEENRKLKVAALLSVDCHKWQSIFANKSIFGRQIDLWNKNRFAPDKKIKLARCKLIFVGHKSICGPIESISTA